MSQNKGFTLVELLIVIAIMGILVAVVVPNVLGMLGRGGEQAYNLDKKTIEAEVAAFWSDTHSKPAGNIWGNGTNMKTGHYYPTASGQSSDWEFGADGNRVSGVVITDGLIWFGLLVNAPQAANSTYIVRNEAAPLLGEKGLYLNEIPKSSIDNRGSYYWIVGKNGKVYGAYLEDSVWYAKFSGSYP